MATRTVKASELQPDPRNLNKGTERGLGMLDHSLRQYGAGRSILVDKHGQVIAGNKTLERAVDIGLDEVLVVQTDGTKLVAVQRTDLDLETDPRARELALADNRVGEVDLAWSAEQLQALSDDGVDLSPFWSEEELAALLAGEPEPFGGEDRAGASPWERMQGNADEGVVMQFGSIAARLPQDLYEAFELACPKDGVAGWAAEVLARGLGIHP